jgi:DNA-binding PadR family transcriptional regulator
MEVSVPLETQTLGRDVNEILVLTTLRDEPKHGYRIALDVKEESDGAFELQHGTLYPILQRLESDGLIEGHWQEEGRRRKVYALTERGEKRLSRDGSRLLDAFRTLGRMMGGDDGTVHPSPATG